MRIEKTKLEGLYIIHLEKFPDNRGYNLPMYQESNYTSEIAKITNEYIHFVEYNLSYSKYSVLRGLHYDPLRWKLCQCLYGRVYYTAVNIETNKHEWMVLSPDKPVQILKAPHLAHGFQIMSREALFYYITSEYYDPGREKIYPWNKFNIQWPILPPIMSEKDRGAT